MRSVPKAICDDETVESRRAERQRAERQNFWLGQLRRTTSLDTTECPFWILCGVERGA